MGDIWKDENGESYYNEEDFAPFDKTIDGYARSKI